MSSSSNTGDLNGSGPFYVQLNIDQGGQNYGGNYTDFLVSVYVCCSSNGWGTYGANGSWSITSSMGHSASGGIPTLDFRPSGSSARCILVAQFWTTAGHDSEGNRPGFWWTASIDTDHSSIGDGTTGQVWVDAPRIPKIPAAPSMNSISGITPNNFTVNYTRGDNRGASIDSDEIEYSRVSDGVVVGTDTSSPPTSSASEAGATLVPGQAYRARGRSHNSQGWGPWSSYINATTLSGIYRYTGTAWVGEESSVWDGSAWKPPTYFTRDSGNTAWVEAV